MTDLSEKAVLVNLTISQWTGRKFDRQVTNEVNKSHGTRDAGRFNKLLVEKSQIGPIANAAYHLRSFHNFNTLPWGDGGDRVLPATKFFEYTQGINERKDKFNELTSEFVTNYVDIREKARADLKELFRASDYPSVDEIANRFKAHVEVQPMPNVKDFRLELASESVVTQLAEEMDANIMDRHQKAVYDLVVRAKNAVEGVVGAINRISSKERSRFGGGLMDKISKLVESIPSLNYTNDPNIERMRQALAKMVMETSTLKSDPVARDNYLKRAKELDQMFF